MQSVILTGGEGFLGKIISRSLKGNITTVGRSANNTLICDLSKEVPGIKKADLVIHCAGKAHVIPKTKNEEQEFYDINYKGTKNLLLALSDNLPESLVFISTVAVYGRETGILINEDHPLKGSTPYAKSKILAEDLVLEWGKKKDISVLILRLPLIAANNPPGNLGKMIQGIKKRSYLSVAAGKARRSMVLAEDVANCIIENYGQSGIYNLTDGYHPSFREVETVICRQLGKSLPLVLPGFLARLLGRMGDLLTFFPIDSGTINKMVNDLTFDDSKAREELNWKSRKVIDHFNIL